MVEKTSSQIPGPGNDVISEARFGPVTRFHLNGNTPLRCMAGQRLEGPLNVMDVVDVPVHVGITYSHTEP